MRHDHDWGMSSAQPSMTRTESVLVGAFLATTCPLLTFVLFWWTAAAVCMHVPGASVRTVKMAALLGLLLGLGLDVVFLKRWVTAFYTVRAWLMLAFYLGLCMVAVAFCMGAPFGTFALGVAAGMYAGRRARHRANDDSAAKAIRRTAVLAACVTTALALPIGILALYEGSVTSFLEGRLGLKGTPSGGAAGFVVVGLLCVILFAVQYWCANLAGRLTYGKGSRNV